MFDVNSCNFQFLLLRLCTLMILIPTPLVIYLSLKAFRHAPLDSCTVLPEDRRLETMTVCTLVFAFFQRRILLSCITVVLFSFAEILYSGFFLSISLFLKEADVLTCRCCEEVICTVWSWSVQSALGQGFILLSTPQGMGLM